MSNRVQSINLYKFQQLSFGLNKFDENKPIYKFKRGRFRNGGKRRGGEGGGGE